MAESSGCCQCLPWRSRRDHFLDAVAEGRVSEVIALLQKHNALVTQPSKNFGGSQFRNCPWHVAAHRGHLEVLHALVDAVLNGSQSSLLFTASLHRKLFSSAAASAASAMPDVVLRSCLAHTIRGGYTPLMLAARAGRVEIVHYLLALGSDCWQVDSHSMTAIHHAARHNKFLVVQELILQAPPPTGSACRLVKSTTKYINVPDLSGWTPLHYAACGKHEETIATLLSCGANMISRTIKPHSSHSSFPPGSTALHIAAMQGNLPMVIQILRSHFEGLASLLPNQLDTMEQRRRQRAHPDPRLVISRTGQLPYHLARPLQRADLCEFLDPSVPLQFLLSAMDEGAPGGGAQGATDGGRGVPGRDLAVVGVPRLSLLAAKALHARLLNNLQDVDRQKAERAARLAELEALERDARLQAAEAEAKEKGMWLVKRAARRSLLMMEQQGDAGGSQSGGGASGSSRKGPRRTSRRPTVPNTPQRLMAAVRSGMGMFTPSRMAASSSRLAPHLRMALEMPENPESNPFARMAPLRRIGSVNSPALQQQQYSVAQVTTRTSLQPPRLSEAVSPTMRSVPVLTAPADLVGDARRLKSHLTARTAMPLTMSSDGDLPRQPALLLTAAHGDADSLVAAAPERESVCAEDTGGSGDSTAPTAPSRWMSGNGRTAEAQSDGAAPAQQFPALPGQALSISAAASEEHAALVGTLPAIRVVRPLAALEPSGTATRLQVPSLGGDSATSTPLVHPAVQHLMPTPMQQLPGAASPVATQMELPSMREGSLSGLVSSATPLASAAGAGGPLRPVVRAQPPLTDSRASVGMTGESAVGRAARNTPEDSADDSDAVPDTGPELDPEDLRQSRSTAQSLLHSLARPFRRTSQVQPMHSLDGSARASAARSSPSQSVPKAPNLAPSRLPQASSDKDAAVGDCEHELADKSQLNPVVEPEEEEDVCPVCLDDFPDVQLTACKHALCLTCAKDLAKRHCLTPALCPYCRAIISGFSLLGSQK